QREMADQKKHSVADRMVSIEQPHVRPIVRGKAGAGVEFGAKIAASLVDGYVWIESMQWDSFNEATTLQASVEAYKQRFGYYRQSSKPTRSTAIARTSAIAKNMALV
ncbi:UNVERIFIED_CONTAM: hypothetical protein ABIC26_005077, partial [Paenibacillus sp. PvR008]